MGYKSPNQDTVTLPPIFHANLIFFFSQKTFCSIDFSHFLLIFHFCLPTASTTQHTPSTHTYINNGIWSFKRPLSYCDSQWFRLCFLHGCHWWHRLARSQGLPQLALRWAPRRRPQRHQGPGTDSRWQLWCLGWCFLNVRLCRQGRPPHRGPFQRHHCRFLHRWRAGHERWLEADQKRCHHLCMRSGGVWGCRYCRAEMDGVPGQARCAPDAGCPPQRLNHVLLYSSFFFLCVFFYVSFLFFHLLCI